MQAARFCDTVVLCQGGAMREEVERHLAAHGPVPSLSFQFVEKSATVKFLQRFPGLYYVGLNLWHRRAHRAAVHLHREKGFEVTHQVNLCTFREPGYLWKFGIPHVWGSWGGTNEFPWRFLLEAGVVGGVIEGVRSLVNRLQFRFSPRVRRAARVSKVLVTNALTQHDFERVHGLPSELIPCNGISKVREEPLPPRPEGGPLRILWCGELRPIKALPLLLKAVAKMPADVPVEVRVLGRGPLEKSWRRLAQRLGVDDRVTWLGWVPHAEALKQYEWADVFTHTALRDTYPTVVLEAFAAGVPVVCLDHHGMSDLVTERCGVKVPVSNPRRVVSELADVFARLARDPERRGALAEGAIERAREFLWPQLGEQMADVYQRVLGETPPNGQTLTGRYDPLLAEAAP